MCLSLCFVLCGCGAMPTAQNVEVKKVNVIEVSASSLDEIEEMASKDVEDTKEKLESERNALGEKITDFDTYTKNVDKVKAFYDQALKQTELLSIRLREYAYKYAELVMNEDASYKVKYKDLSGIYEYIYDDAAKTMYDIYDKTLKDMYDIYYDGVIKMMESLRLRMMLLITSSGMTHVQTRTMIGMMQEVMLMIYGMILVLIFMIFNMI